jgi:mRNA interferase HigB
MTFANLANNSSLFVDANTFIYHFTLHPHFASPSTKLLGRIARQEIRGFNIGGNKYRLITAIHYNRKRVYVRHVLTHKEYDRGQWKND